MFALPSPRQLLGGMEPARFLAEHWQKRPRLIRQAFPGLVSPISPEELAGLACEEEIESRIVLEQGARGPWELRRGPFEEADFTHLPAERWTLLVQDVEKHLPELAPLLEPFRFLPDWRIDDLMISYAAPGGSVGPHVDQYDVFLLQAQGRRRWQIQYPAPAEERLLPDLELRILAEFEASEEWVLEPGDMLYLPPGVPHFGVAFDACLTYSVGFRAPSDKELAAGLLDRILSELPERSRFGDPGRGPQSNPGVLAEADLAALRERFRRQLQVEDGRLDRWLAAVLTEPKPAFFDKPQPRRISAATLGKRLAAGLRLQRNPASRFALVEQRPAAFLYVDGEEFALNEELIAFGQLLAARTELAALDPTTLPSGALELLLELYRLGHWLAQPT